MEVLTGCKARQEWRASYDQTGFVPNLAHRFSRNAHVDGLVIASKACGQRRRPATGAPECNPKPPRST